jgi:hypothetical protein
VRGSRREMALDLLQMRGLTRIHLGTQQVSGGGCSVCIPSNSTLSHSVLNCQNYSTTTHPGTSAIGKFVKHELLALVSPGFRGAARPT